MSKTRRLAQLHIDAYTKDGMGLGTWSLLEGKARQVEVPFSMPGDEVEVLIRKGKRGLLQGIPLKWVEVSKDRVTPRCSHFGQCGGCRWQHIAYSEQLLMKEEMVMRHFRPFLQGGVDVHPIIPCDPPWEYRNKMELSFSSDKEGRRYLGLILFGTRGHVFQMHECYLMRPWVADAVRAVSQWWEGSGLDAYHMGGDRGSLRTLVLREGERSGDRLVMLTVSGNPDYALKDKQISDFVDCLRNAIEPVESDKKLSVFLRIQQIAKGKATQYYEMLLYGPDHIRETLYIETKPGEQHSLNFRISPTAFFQPNTRQAEKLYSKAIQLTGASLGGVVYDLYCGTGTLGICMAKDAEKVIGIELSPESALDARENVKANRLSHVTIHTGDVGQILPKLIEDDQTKPQVVMVDPPRAGLDDRALQHLIALDAPFITYISCNPATQALNIEVLSKVGYRLKALQPVDQFSQTLHVENIVTLCR